MKVYGIEKWVDFDTALGDFDNWDGRGVFNPFLNKFNIYEEFLNEEDFSHELVRCLEQCVPVSKVDIREEPDDYIVRNLYFDDTSDEISWDIVTPDKFNLKSVTEE